MHGLDIFASPENRKQKRLVILISVECVACLMLVHLITAPVGMVAIHVVIGICCPNRFLFDLANTTYWHGSSHWSFCLHFSGVEDCGPSGLSSAVRASTERCLSSESSLK